MNHVSCMNFWLTVQLLLNSWDQIVAVSFCLFQKMYNLAFIKFIKKKPRIIWYSLFIWSIITIWSNSDFSQCDFLPNTKLNENMSPSPTLIKDVNFILVDVYLSHSSLLLSKFREPSEKNRNLYKISSISFGTYPLTGWQKNATKLQTVANCF